MYAAWIITANTETQVRAATSFLTGDGLRHEPLLGFFKSQDKVIGSIDKQGRMVMSRSVLRQSDQATPDFWWSDPWFYGEWKQLVLQEIDLI